MRFRSPRAFPLALLLLAGVLTQAPPTHGQHWPIDQLIDGIAMAAGAISLDEAVDRAQRRFNARVVRADVRESNGRTYYVLRLLSEEGRVWTVRVDAATGEFQ